MASEYPVHFTVDYPDRQLDRLSSAFRIFTVIPIAVVLCAFGGSGSSLLSLPPLLLILFRQKYPRWWYDWNFNVMSFTNRVTVYGLLMTDVYPATDEEQSAHLALPYPDVKSDLNRWLPLVKWLLAIPHYIVLFFLFVGVVVAAVIALVRDPLHGALSEGPVRLHRRRPALGQSCRCLRVRPHDRRLPALQPLGVTPQL